MRTEPCTVLVWGDSIAASGWPQRAESIFNTVLNTGRSIKVVNKAVGGLPASVACKEFSETVLPEKPETVAIQFGLNDLRHDGSRGSKPISTPFEFGQHLTSMVDMCMNQLNATVILFANHKTRPLITMPMGISYDEIREKYNDVILKVARAKDINYCNMEERLKAARLLPEQVLSEDGVHLSPLGLEAYAQIAASEFFKVLANKARHRTGK